MSENPLLTPVDEALPAVAVSVSMRRVRGGVSMIEQDAVVEEWPIALEYNGISHVVMMATPADLEDFALGFSLSEGILQHPDELYECELIAAEPGVIGTTVALKIAAERFAGLKQQRRNLIGRTGCGLCGAENLAQACRSIGTLDIVGEAPTLERIAKGMAALAQRQPLQALTGGSHAAGWLRSDGTLALVREDVGRHNALDKLIGAMARAGENPGGGAVLMTSRASLEIVQKAALAGIGVVAAVSAPTALAIRTAETAGVTLLAFVRPGACGVYAHAQRLDAEKATNPLIGDDVSE